MPDVPAPEAKRSWRERLAGSVFNRDVRDLFARHPLLDDALLEELTMGYEPDDDIALLVIRRK